MIYLFSLPERLLRFLAASLGGLLFELTELLLPRGLRRTRLYQALIYRMLRITVELVGDVRSTQPADQGDVGELAKRKAIGNAVELLSFVAVGWSPLWLLAATSDITGGTRTYLAAFITELQNEGLLQEVGEIKSVDELLNALQASTQVAADLVDTPPLNVQDLRSSWMILKQNTSELPKPEQLTRLFYNMQELARQEGRSVGELSALLAGGALRAGLQLGSTHIFQYYQGEFEAIHKEGWGTYALRVARPYIHASRSHFDPQRETYTERVLRKLRQNRDS